MHLPSQIDWYQKLGKQFSGNIEDSRLQNVDAHGLRFLTSYQDFTREGYAHYCKIMSKAVGSHYMPYEVG